MAAIFGDAAWTSLQRQLETKYGSLRDDALVQRAQELVQTVPGLTSGLDEGRRQEVVALSGPACQTLHGTLHAKYGTLHGDDAGDSANQAAIKIQVALSRAVEVRERLLAKLSSWQPDVPVEPKLKLKLEPPTPKERALLIASYERGMDVESQDTQQKEWHVAQVLAPVSELAAQWKENAWARRQHEAEGKAMRERALRDAARREREMAERHAVDRALSERVAVVAAEKATMEAGRAARAAAEAERVRWLEAEESAATIRSVERERMSTIMAVAAANAKQNKVQEQHN